MLTKIRVQRFRGFSDFTLEVSQPVSALLGGNSSGKTSLLQAVRIGCLCAEQALGHADADPRKDGEWVSVVGRAGVVEPAAILPLLDWRQLFVEGRGGDNINAEITLTFSVDDPISEIYTALGYGRNEKLLLTVALRGAMPTAVIETLPPRTRDRAVRFRQGLAAALPVAVFAPAFYGVTRQEEFRTAKVIERALGSSDQSHIVRNLVARLDSIGLDRLNQFLQGTFGARIERRSSASDFEQLEHLETHYTDGNGELELSSAGTGLTSAIALYSALDFLRRSRGPAGGRPALLLLDEPEAHLHPRLQGKVGDALATVARDFGVQALFATHSVELCNRLGRRDDVMLANVDRRSESAVRLTKETDLVRALDEICDLTPYSSLSFLRSRRVVFYEGPSDWRILSICAQYLFAVDKQRLDAWADYVGIPLGGVGNVSAKGVLEKILTPELFSDRLAPTRPFRSVLVHDRDAKTEATPLTRATPKPHLETVELTWSRYSIESLFIEPEILAAWIGSLDGLRGSAIDLRAIVHGAIAHANRDQELLDEARGLRMKYLARADDKGNINFKDAHDTASRDVASHPEIWQHGRNRIKRVLGHVREQLRAMAPRAASQLRTDLADLLEAVPLSSVGPGPTPVPDEVRALLNAMVA